MDAGMRRSLGRAAAIGLTARMIVFSAIGVFLLRAAAEFDPDEAIGLDGALHRLAEGAHGPWVLGGVGLGLIAYGLYQLAQARYRDLGESAAGSGGRAGPAGRGRRVVVVRRVRQPG